MSRTVVFGGIEVDVSEELYPDVEDMDDEELEEAARELLYSAPFFDELSEHMISELEVLEIE